MHCGAVESVYGSTISSSVEPVSDCERWRSHGMRRLAMLSSGGS